tara:strand:+ start:577 stop:1563 length:987 start_codon:yes stop_codon:yes gene_type:complete
LDKTVYRILLIGAGNLGSRHLQGMAKTDQNLEILVVDPDPNALESANYRFEQMPMNAHVHSVRYYQNISELDDKFDLAIIATNADIRRKVIENLVTSKKVKYLLLEKVVFQSVQDFKDIIPLLEEMNIKSWVNCPRRMVPFFRHLRKNLKNNRITIRASGSKWGMASNAIHYFDLFAFLTRKKEIIINMIDLFKRNHNPKRPGFIEFGGRLVAKTKDGDILEILDDDNKKIPWILSIESNKKKIEINQLEGLYKIYSNNNLIQVIEKPFYMPLQSELTHILIEQVIKTGDLSLPTLEESFLLHKPMLEAFNKYLSNISDKTIIICPIT